MKRVELVFKSCSEHFKHHFCNLQCNLKSPAAINITALQTFYFSCLLHFGNKFYQKFLLLWILWGNFINPLWAPPTFFSLLTILTRAYVDEKFYFYTAQWWIMHCSTLFHWVPLCWNLILISYLCVSNWEIYQNVWVINLSFLGI